MDLIENWINNVFNQCDGKGIIFYYVVLMVTIPLAVK